jgi:formylglycine-generating enzyme required for sulfatase activity
LDGGAQVRVWPLRRINSRGEMAFVSDPAFGDLPVIIRKQLTDVIPEPMPRPTVDIESWLEETLAQTGHIDIRGIGSGAGTVRSASRYPIERLYTQLRCREQGMTGESGSGLEALLPRHRLLLIEGQPGAGKTTFLRFTAALLARDLLEQPAEDGGAWRKRYLGMDTSKPAPIPVFLRLASMEALLARSDTLRPDNWERFLELMLPQGSTLERAGWRALFEAGEVLLLLDGMDEVTDEGRRGRVFAILRGLVRHWRDTRVVLTSRPIDIRPLVEMGFTHTEIEPFAKRQVADFIEHWVGALYDTGPGAEPGTEARGYQGSLLTAITERPQLRRLAANPVMLTCLCVVHWNEGGLPDARARLYRAVLHWLRAARASQRLEMGISDSFAERAYPALALTMMYGRGDDDSGKRVLFDLEDATEALRPIANRDFPKKSVPERLMLLRRWLRFECTGSGIIEELGRNRLRFWHLTFQEYLAAQQLAWLGDGEGEDDWWPRIRLRLDDPQWRETVELLPGCLLDEGGQRRVDRLLDRVLGLLGNDAGLPAQARVAGVVGHLLEPMGGYGYRPAPRIQARYDELLEAALAIFEPSGAAQVPVADRIAAAEALGRGGDPRIARGLANLIEVPGSEGWSLGKYAVTVEEYLAFIDNGGYIDLRWWESTSWKQKEQGGWEAPGDWESQLLTPNRPVVSLSWFEASAYCAWLSVQWDRLVRLPSGVLWQRAAGGEDAYLYPWGEGEPDSNRANFGHQMGGPSPVGVYPAGNGPFGHCDLMGNVWEWCSDLLVEDNLPDYLYGEAGEERVLRGGGWLDPARRLQAANRSRYPAKRRDDDVGFRVAVAPASLGH